MDNKKPWQSKTIILNAILGVLAAVAAFIPSASSLSQYITEHAAQIAMGWSVASILLRTISKNKIVLSD